MPNNWANQTLKDLGDLGATVAALVTQALSVKRMNKEIELHDSTLSEIKREEGKLILIFDTAIVHNSYGQPGIDNGTCWEQKIEIIFSNAAMKIHPNEIPIEIADGWLIANNQEYRNMFSTSLNIDGDIVLNLITAYNENLNIEGNHIEVHEIGDPVYLLDFIGSK